MPLALIIYKFDGVPDHPVLVCPMGMQSLTRHTKELKRALRSFSKTSYIIRRTCYVIKEVFLKVESAGDIYLGIGFRLTISTGRLSNKQF